MFNGSLFGFQSEDVQQLKTMRARLVGNDPGTGKTYVGIAMDQLNRAGDGNAKVNLAELFPRGTGKKTLVVCPKSVIDSWDQHTTDLTADDVFVVDTKNREVIMRQLLNKKTDGYFIVNWEFLRLEQDRLKKVYFFHIIADEVHRAKNRKAQSTRALKMMQTVYKTGMSGTPADNKPQDLWSILNWLWPNYYTSYWRFVNSYIVVTEEQTKEGKGYKKLEKPNATTIPKLHAEMKPWFSRRRKEDVLPDLPDKYYTERKVDLDPKQRRAYDQMRKTMMAWVEDHADQIAANDPVVAIATVSQLVRLQQYADGYLVPQLDANGEQVIKINHKKSHVKGEPCTEVCVESPQWDMVDPSSKLDSVMDLLADREGEQIIVWSQFKSAITLFEERLAKAGISYGLLTGDVGQADRAKNVQDFQAGKHQIFTGTIAAGGVGITLTASSTVVFIDRTWSPSINLQAEDRAHRIGQPNAVEIIDIIAKNTVDLGKHQKLAMKQEFLAMMLGDKPPVKNILRMLEEE